MNTTQAADTIKAINRHLRRKRILAGGLSFGLDFATWSIIHPHMAHTLQCAQVITGRPGRYLPRWRYTHSTREENAPIASRELDQRQQDTE